MSDLNIKYVERYDTLLVPLAARIQEYIREYFSAAPRIERVVARAKGIDQFLSKAEKRADGERKYSDPLNQIQDQVGARIITLYPDDVPIIAERVEACFRSIETRVVVPDSDSEFGYFGKHYILLIPSDVISQEESYVLPFFELQIKTLFQHAWSEANHDLGYKHDMVLTPEFKRRIAFTSAQAWGADQIFNDLQRELNH